MSDNKEVLEIKTSLHQEFFSLYFRAAEIVPKENVEYYDTLDNVKMEMDDLIKFLRPHMKEVLSNIVASQAEEPFLQRFLEITESQEMTDYLHSQLKRFKTLAAFTG